MEQPPGQEPVQGWQPPPAGYPYPPQQAWGPPPGYPPGPVYPPYYPPPAAPRRSAVGQWAVALGVIGLFVAGIPVGIAAFVCGCVELSAAQREGRPTGSGRAGIILGVIDVLAGIVLINLLY